MYFMNLAIRYLDKCSVIQRKGDKMKSDEMKLKKYEILVKDIDTYLGRTGLSGEMRTEIIKNVEGEDESITVPISPLEFLLDKPKDNKWLEGIFDNTFLKRGVGMMSIDTCINLIDIEKDDVMKFLERIRKCNSCTNTSFNNPKYCNVPYHLLFWLIFSMSVDNENYNNNLSVVSDVAYILNFDEEMVKDWIAAVKGVLEGKKLQQINYKTDAAKKFFVR